MNEQHLDQPILRFKSFDTPWAKAKIIDIASVTTGDKDTQNKIDGGLYPFFVRSQTVEKINTYSYDGEAILTSGDGVGVGKNFHYINGKFDFHQRVYCLHKFSEQISGKFLFYLFSEKFYKRVMSLSAKNSVDSIRRSMITDMEIYFPNLDEQSKIANFLSSIDQKINILTERFTNLENYKKGLLNKFFNKDLAFKDSQGNSYPEWQTKRLDDIADVIMGQSPSSASYNQNGEGVLLIQGNADIKDRKTLPRTWTTEKTKECHIGDILFTVRAPVGAVAMSIHNGCIGRGVSVIRPNQTCMTQYLFQLLVWYEDFKWKPLEQGSTFTAVSGNEIKSIDVPLPCIEEQTKLANFLSAIDEKISNTKSQLNLTKQYKQGLLQQMFV